MPARELVQLVRDGLPMTALEDLRQELGLALEPLAAKLGLSRATLHRRRRTGRLASDESDRAVRFGRLLLRAREVFGDAADARLWLGSPQVGLGGAVPLDYAETEVGAREVEDLLGRIDHNVYT